MEWRYPSGSLTPAVEMVALFCHADKGGHETKIGGNWLLPWSQDGPPLAVMGEISILIFLMHLCIWASVTAIDSNKHNILRPLIVVFLRYSIRNKERRILTNFFFIPKILLFKKFCHSYVLPVNLAKPQMPKPGELGDLICNLFAWLLYEGPSFILY